MKNKPTKRKPKNSGSIASMPKKIEQIKTKEFWIEFEKLIGVRK